MLGSNIKENKKQTKQHKTKLENGAISALVLLEAKGAVKKKVPTIAPAQ